ncbi:MAG: 4Fe-4S double cluster binding domain-containing protein [Dehalobacterium sp.]
MENIDLKEELRQMVFQLGGDLFGVAGFDDVADKISEEYGDTFKDLDRAISAAVFFPKAVLNELADGPTHTYLYYYDVINVRLNDIALRASNFLQKKGYKIFPIPASQRVNESKLAGIFSHRLAAHRAGLGWIGKNCSLINPEVGPRLRLVTVLTNAPLPADKPFEEGRCGNCTACQEACPPQAIKGSHFRLGDPLELRLDAQSCHDYLSKVRQSFGKRICGRCLAVCPWGK